MAWSSRFPQTGRLSQSPADLVDPGSGLGLVWAFDAANLKDSGGGFCPATQPRGGGR